MPFHFADPDSSRHGKSFTCLFKAGFVMSRVVLMPMKSNSEIYFYLCYLHAKVSSSLTKVSLKGSTAFVDPTIHPFLNLPQTQSDTTNLPLLLPIPQGDRTSEKDTFSHLSPATRAPIHTE